MTAKRGIEQIRPQKTASLPTYDGKYHSTADFLLDDFKFAVSSTIQLELSYPENTNLRGSITAQLICLFSVDSAAFLMLNEQQFYLFSQILASQTVAQLYSDSSPYWEWSLSYQISYFT